MHPRIERRGSPRRPHFPHRCRAAVEVLDARRLMAASVTGTSVLALTGGLDPTTGTRFVGSNDILTEDAPTFTGTTTAGAVVVVSATDVASEQTLIVGSGVADASGNWSVTTVPLAGGFYSFSATATSPASGSATILLTGGPGVYPTYLGIDTGPTVTGFRVTSAKAGTFEVDYTDPSELPVAAAVDRSSITVSRTVSGSSRAQALRVTSLTAAVGAVRNGAGSTNSFVPVSGRFAIGRSAPRNATYVFTIHSAEVASLSGAPLDGEYNGQFPSGNGVAGGNFQIKITVHNGKVTGISPITSADVAARAVPTRAVGKHQA